MELTIGFVGANMNIFESLDKQEVIDFFNKTKPDFWKAETRVDIETLNTIYVLRWVKIKKTSHSVSLIKVFKE